MKEVLPPDVRVKYEFECSDDKPAATGALLSQPHHVWGTACGCDTTTSSGGKPRGLGLSDVFCLGTGRKCFQLSQSWQGYVEDEKRVFLCETTVDQNFQSALGVL